MWLFYVVVTVVLIFFIFPVFIVCVHNHCRVLLYNCILISTVEEAFSCVTKWDHGEYMYGNLSKGKQTQCLLVQEGRRKAESLLSGWCERKEKQNHCWLAYYERGEKQNHCWLAVVKERERKTESLLIGSNEKERKNRIITDWLLWEREQKNRFIADWL